MKVISALVLASLSFALEKESTTSPNGDYQKSCVEYKLTVEKKDWDKALDRLEMLERVMSRFNQAGPQPLLYLNQATLQLVLDHHFKAIELASKTVEVVQARAEIKKSANLLLGQAEALVFMSYVKEEDMKAAQPHFEAALKFLQAEYGVDSKSVHQALSESFLWDLCAPRNPHQTVQKFPMEYFKTVTVDSGKKRLQYGIKLKGDIVFLTPKVEAPPALKKGEVMIATSSEK